MRNIKTFKVNENIEVVCESQNTRYGFRHLATLLYNGNECETAKCCYYNRTWERYEFQSVLENLADKTKRLSEAELKLFKDYIENYNGSNRDFQTISTIALLGEVFCNTQKQKNDWKERMLRAGLENKGLIMPDDWSELSEPEKEKRLNGVIAELNK